MSFKVANYFGMECQLKHHCSHTITSLLWIPTTCADWISLTRPTVPTLSSGGEDDTMARLAFKVQIECKIECSWVFQTEVTSRPGYECYLWLPVQLLFLMHGSMDQGLEKSDQRTAAQSINTHKPQQYGGNEHTFSNEAGMFRHTFPVWLVQWSCKHVQVMLCLIQWCGGKIRECRNVCCISYLFKCYAHQITR